MENKFWKEADPSILQEAATRFAVSKDQLKKLGESTNLVYGYEQHGKGFILRVTHSSQTPWIHQMQGELDWIRHLVAHGVRASKPVCSTNGAYIELIETEEGSYLATSFEKAEGRAVEKQDWNADLYEQWGKVLGRMHALSKGYTPDNPAHKRLTHAEKYTIAHTEKALAGLSSLVLILEKQREVMNHLSTLPQDKDTYGLIHSDLEDENFFIDNGEIVAFDFDDCHYNWFLYDIVTVVRQASWMIPPSQVKGFLESFFNGYLWENQLDSSWVKRNGHLFFKWKEIDSYVSAYERLDIESLSEKEKAPFEGMKNWIIHDQPWKGLNEMMKLFDRYLHF